ncbi:MAG: 30S ribosomal protein S16 [Candidatus Fraserbacteria bacterium RBG_16_55_9]|uniref:Small ribosomal subunit protein bS16 n=1 Tax=Fraserbacteria sp. (strain RBG_16_55_9) TaxID=1817864 RepID=A0A1F5UQ28_FRAXR|nr:MAG: 30S ribosomal protein S16 [Candidatus Fraserbacteria bacterium RBG_16_55_9]
MAAKIRLKRTGRRGQASFRLVVVDEDKPRDTWVVDDLGAYNPRTEELSVDNGRALTWLKLGAQPTQTARMLLSKVGLMAQLASQRRSSAPSP